MLYLLPQSVSNAAVRYPDHAAVCYAKNCLTYSELDARSNSLAHHLIETGLQRGERVGIYMNKGLESAISIYGIMKAGGAYVPLDPFAPTSRIAFVMRDCEIRHLVSKEAKLDALRQVLAEGTPLEHLIGVSDQPDLHVSQISWEDVYQSSPHALDIHLTEQDLAYILYTSGSTGVPKGIMHTHRSGLSFANWAADEYGLTSEDRLSNHAPLHFDLSTFDFFAGAIAGATTVIIPEALTKFPTDLSKLIENQRISVWYSVPFALIQLMEHGSLESRDLSALRWLLFAGEVFPTKHLRQLMTMLPKVRFSNLYGPTETNVCTYYHVNHLPENSDQPIPIGKVCSNVEDLVVDMEDRAVGSGEVGELLIRGGVVMKGYWGQPEKTSNGFYRRLAFSQFEDQFYRTGDLVQLDEEGNYHYLGRKDRQIKTRGYRVELDEVEVALLSHPAVQEAAVYPIPDGQGSNLIEASVIPRRQIELTEDELVQLISRRLPPYAIPARIYIVKDFPRTSTGKINRRELQALATERLSDKSKIGEH
jgi:amino acid adenylation domain-containing protein